MIRRIPVILDTDIGTDIDDTWALAMMLRSPEIDTKLIVSDTGDTVFRAKLVAKFLECAGRADIPVGVGIPLTPNGLVENQRKWVEDYDLANYPGPLHMDGVQSIIDTIMDSLQPVTLVCIGPVPNVAAALEREPEIAQHAHFVGMHGSIYKKYDGVPGTVAEYNVIQDVAACQKVFNAPWLSCTITPLDTCGTVRLDGERYAKLASSHDPIVNAVLENYHIWGSNYDVTASSILFDTVAIHLAYSHAYLKMEKMGIRVTNDGFTVPDADTQHMNVAIDWIDLDAFHNDLTKRLLGEVTE